MMELADIKNKVQGFSLEDLEQLKKEVDRLYGIAKANDPNSSIASLDIPPRLYWCLRHSGFDTISSLKEAKESEIKKFRNVGPTSIKYLREELLRFSIKLKA